MGHFPFAPTGQTTIQYVAPSGDTTGATDAANLTAAAASIPAKGGVVRMAATAPWYIACGSVSINRSGLYIDAQGCYINAVGAGDVFRMFDSSTYNGRTIQGGGILGFPIIDGTSTTGNSNALNVGDILQLEIYVQVQNFTAGTTSKGVYFNNANFWTEQCYGRIYASNCTAHVVFDETGATTSTGSFARGDLGIYLNQVTPSNDGVVFQNGALLYDGAIAIRGNFGTSASALTSAVLRATGTSPVGHPDAGAFSGIKHCRIDIGVELDGAGAHAPTTVAVGSSSNALTVNYGTIDFGSGATFAAAAGAAGSALYPFNGVISGDATLATISGYPFTTTWNIPGGLALGNFAGATALSNNSTIATASVGTVRVSSTGNVTGIILGAGSFDGQVCSVVNTTGFTVTFAASGTSHVADGVSDVIAANTARMFIWDGSVTNLWYRNS